MNEAQPMNGGGRPRTPSQLATFDDVNMAARLMAQVTAQKLGDVTRRLAQVEAQTAGMAARLGELEAIGAQLAQCAADIEGRVIAQQGDVDAIDTKMDRMAAIESKVDRITAVEQKLDRLLELLKAAAAAPIKGDT